MANLINMQLQGPIPKYMVTEHDGLSMLDSNMLPVGDVAVEKMSKIVIKNSEPKIKHVTYADMVRNRNEIFKG